MRRILKVVFDRVSADDASAQLSAAVTDAGTKGGAGFVKELRAAFDKSVADLKVKLAQGLIDPVQFKAQASAAAQQFNVGILAGMEQARAAGNLTDSEYLKLSRTLKTVGTTGEASGSLIASSFAKAGAAIAAFFALQKIESFFASAIHGAADQEAATGQLDGVLRNLGTTYQAIAPEANTYLDALTETTRFTRSDAIQALANLITITGDYGKSLGLLSLTADVATKKHETMAEAADTVGKASLGLAKGLGDLGIRTGQTGDLIGALRANLSGLAEQEGQTTAGKLQTLNNLWDEFKIKVGQAIIASHGFQDGSSGLAGSLIKMNQWVNENAKDIGALIDITLRVASAFGSVAAKIVGFIDGVNHFIAAKDTFWAQLAQGNGLAGSATVAWMQFTQKTTDATVSGQAAQTSAVATGIATRRTLTAAEQAVLSKLIGDGSGERVALTAKEAALVSEIYKETGAGHLTLTKEQADAVTKYRKDRAADATKAAEDFEKTFTQIQDDAESDRLKRLDQAQRERIELLEKYNKLIAQMEKDAGAKPSAAQQSQIDQAKHLRDIALAAQETAATPETKDTTLGALAPVEPEDVNDIAFLQRIQQETDLLDARTAAQKRGTDALADFDRQQKIANAYDELVQDALRNHVKITTDLIDKLHRLAVAQVDNNDKTKHFTLAQQAATDISKQLQKEVGDLAMAWAEGGIAGIGAYARQQARLMFAQALSAAAQGLLGSLFGDPTALAKGEAAAAGFAAAGVAMAAIGGGISGPTSSSGSAGTSGASSATSAATSTEPAQQDVNIYLEGPGFDALNPRVQDVVFGAQQVARERYGDNARIRVIRQGTS
jgi:hypothetical protein